MLPANFPARKDARRHGALQRLLAPPTNPEREETPAQRSARADLLALKLNGNARAVRSKKVRGVGRLGRLAERVAK